MTPQQDLWHARDAKVNPHYLARVVDLSEHREVFANEDIFDERGLKLIAKGSRVDRSTQERLVRFKLRKPLETTVVVEGGISAEHLFELAERLIDTHAATARTLVGSSKEAVILDMVRQLRLDNASTLLLSLQHHEHTRMEHGLLVALLAAGIGARMNASDTQLHEMLLAGALHDVGELYVEPGVLARAGQLAPHEWRQVAGHTVIGQVVVQETTAVPSGVARAIGEHHERCSGYGYPRQLTGAHISALGKVLQTAEMISGLISRADSDPDRIRHALNLVDGDFPREIASAVCAAFASPGARQAHSAQRDVGGLCQRAESVLLRIEAAIGWIAEHAHLKPTPCGLADEASDRLRVLRAALHSTGICAVGQCLQVGALLSHAEQVELEAIVDELNWRLSELARVIALRAHTLGEAAASFAQALYLRLLPAQGA